MYARRPREINVDLPHIARVALEEWQDGVLESLRAGRSVTIMAPLGREPWLRDELGNAMAATALARASMEEIWLETGGDYFSDAYQQAQAEYDGAMARQNAVILGEV